MTYLYYIFIYSEVILTVTTHGVIFNETWYNFSSNADLSLPAGEWAFIGVSVYTADGVSTITIYNRGLVIDFVLPSTPVEVDGK